MNKYKKDRLLSASSIQKLKELIGGTYKYLGGSSLSVFRTGFVSIVTEASAVTVCADLELRDFEGFEDEYPQVFVLEADPEEIRKMESGGSMYVQGQGQVIKAVSLIRETLVASDRGVEVWSETSDIGVLIHLERLTISIGLLTNFEVLFFVDFHANFDISQLEATAMVDSDNLFRTLDVSREIIPLESGARV